MEHKTIKRIGAASLVALHIFTMQAWAQTTCSASTGLGAVFSVLGEGSINLHADEQCNLEFFHGNIVNASNTNKLTVAGSAAALDSGKRCKTQADAGSSIVSTQSIDVVVKQLSQRTLHPFSESKSSFTVELGNGSAKFGSAAVVQNLNNAGSPTSWTWNAWGYLPQDVTATRSGTVFTLPAGNYDTVKVQDGSSAVFSGPVRIKHLLLAGCNGASVTFAQDTADIDEPSSTATTQTVPSQTYVNDISFASNCSMYKSGVGRTTLNILGKAENIPSSLVVNTTLSGGSQTCINYPSCANSTKDFANMDIQHPERLQINVYNGNLVMSSQYAMAAGIYVNDGVFDLGNGTGSTIVGEILAGSIVASNNSGTKLFSKSTSEATPRDGAYSLTPPVTGEVTDKDSLVYRAMQKDSPGTSGHLMAFKLKDDSSQDTTAQWGFGALETTTSKATSITDRTSKLKTESSDWATVAVDFAALSTTASGSTLSQACVVDPTQTACRISSDPRNINSLVGTPWRIAPMIVGDSVLFATDDGVLYSVDKTSGALNWGWVPSAILAAIQTKLEGNPKALLDAHPWGQIASVDVLENDSSTPPLKVKKTYVTGTALGGKLHFSIQVGTNGKTLEKVVWLDSRTTEYSPGSAGNTNDGEAGWSSGVYGRPYGGAAPISAVTGGNKVAYVVGGKLVTREVNSMATATESAFSTGTVTDPASASASPLIVPSSNLLYVDDSAIYFGAADGKVYKSNTSGQIETGDNGIDKVTVSTPASAIWYVNGSRITSANGNGLMLLAQTQYQVSALKYFSEKWSFAWSAGISPTTKLGVSSPITNPAISVVASDNAYLSAPADIINGVVLMYYTKKPSACDIRGYTFGPLKLLDGTDAKSGSFFRNTSMTSLDNYVGKGDATGGAFTRWKGKRAIIAGTGGDPSNAGDTAAIVPAENVFRDRLNWRELTNFF